MSDYPLFKELADSWRMMPQIAINYSELYSSLLNSDFSFSYIGCFAKRSPAFSAIYFKSRRRRERSMPVPWELSWSQTHTASSSTLSSFFYENKCHNVQRKLYALYNLKYEINEMTYRLRYLTTLLTQALLLRSLRTMGMKGLEPIIHPPISQRIFRSGFRFFRARVRE